MRKYAFIPTRAPVPQKLEIEQYLEEAGFEVTLLEGEKNIFEAYANAVKNVMADDTVILCHDDISIITNKEAFNSIIENALSKSSVGFVGVAGTKLLGRSAVWWEGIGRDHHFTGAVFHGKDYEKMYYTNYGDFGPAVVLDGVFLAAKGRTLHSIQMTKPKSFTGCWDFYDIFYTFQAAQKKLINVTVPIQILHSSPGEIAGRESWHANRTAFCDIFSDKLPAMLRNHKQ
jgi:hypothetical protein